MKIIDAKYEEVAQQAFKQYDLRFEKNEFYCESTNVFFKAYGEGGEVYGLKICREDTTKLEDNMCEAFFLEKLAPKVDFPIPGVVLNKDGDSVSVVNSPDFEQPVRTILFKWVQGEDFVGNETLELFFELGRAMAKMHKAAEEFDISDTLVPKKWDCVFYFRDEPVVFRDEPYAKKLGSKNIALLNEAIGFADGHLQRMAEKYSSLLLHGDINPWNVLLCEKGIGIIDFEDSILGYPAQDIAVLLFYYRHREEYGAFKESLIKGYNSLIPEAEFDDFELEILMFARQLNFVNFAFVFFDDPWEYVNRNMKVVEDSFNELRVKSVV